MGWPVTSYLVMQSLLETIDEPLDVDPHEMDPHEEFHRRMTRERLYRRHGRQSWEAEAQREIRRSLRAFSLLAFVLHSPTRHADLHRKLNSDFEILDETTGNELLFFVAIEAKEEWVLRNSDRHYLSKIKARSTAGARSLRCVDSDAALAAMARALSIEELPAIVVINPKAPQDRVILPTSAIEIEQQLGRLGRCAERYNSRAPLVDQLRAWRLEEVVQLSPNHRSLERLTMALAAVSVSSGDFSSRIAKPLLNERIQSIRRENFVHSVRKNSESEPDDFIIGLLLDAAFYLSQIYWKDRHRKDHSNLFEEQPLIEPFNGLDRNALELDTSSALASAEALLKSGAQLEDWSPLAICFAKAFESEINASVVQFYRELLGVKLPDFFKKHAPGVVATVNTESNPIDFNSKRGPSGWHPPSLGQTLWVAIKK
jgi:hypothetical protein